MMLKRRWITTWMAALSVLAATLYCACLGESVTAVTAAVGPVSCCTSHAPPPHRDAPSAPRQGCPHCGGGTAFDRGGGGVAFQAGASHGPTLVALANLPAADGGITWVERDGRAGVYLSVDRENQSLLRLHCALRI